MTLLRLHVIKRSVYKAYKKSKGETNVDDKAA